MDYKATIFPKLIAIKKSFLFATLVTNYAISIIGAFRGLTRTAKNLGRRA